jgi:general secretion pathway protein A
LNKSILPVHLTSLGLDRNPFPQTPDADSYFRTEGIEQQYSETLHCVLSGKGFTLLSGEVGIGKSTFLRFLMDDLVKADCSISFVFNTFLQGRDLLLAVNRDFGLSAGADFADDFAAAIDRLNHFLIDQHALGKTCVVVIDDAQNLNGESLELLRLLSNLETRQTKLLQIVLSGQPEILEVLAKREIRQFTSRIVHHTQLINFTKDECARYVDFRISSSGSDGRIHLDKNALSALYRHSKGNPRRVNLIMDRCMYGVLATGQHEISKRLLDTAAGEVGVMANRHPRFVHFPTAAINWSMGVLVFLGVALAAWSSIPSTAISPAKNPATTNTISVQTAPQAQTLDTFLKKRTFPPFNATLGKRGSDVRLLQQQLTEVGFYTAPVDGIVGVHTLNGLNAFRRQHGLSPDGNVDDRTLFLLEQNLNQLREEEKNNG